MTVLTLEKLNLIDEAKVAADVSYFAADATLAQIINHLAANLPDYEYVNHKSTTVLR